MISEQFDLFLDSFSVQVDYWQYIRIVKSFFKLQF